MTGRPFCLINFPSLTNWFKMLLKLVLCIPNFPDKKFVVNLGYSSCSNSNEYVVMNSYTRSLLFLFSFICNSYSALYLPAAYTILKSILYFNFAKPPIFYTHKLFFRMCIGFFTFFAILYYQFYHVYSFFCYIYPRLYTFFYFFLLKPKNTDIFIQIPLSVLSFSNILLGIC